MGKQLPRIISDRAINSLVNTAITMSGGDIAYIITGTYRGDEGSVLEDTGDAIRWANEESSEADRIAVRDYDEYDEPPEFVRAALAQTNEWDMLSIPEALSLIRECIDACSAASGWPEYWRASDILDTLLWFFVSQIPGYRDAEQVARQESWLYL